MKIIKTEVFWLSLIIIIAFTVRLYKIDNPIADWHSWRQSDTAAVARNFFKDGYNPFIPKYDDMSGVAEEPIANPERYRFVEFPIYNSLVYFAYFINSGVDERLARLVNIAISLGSLIFVFLISRRYFGKLTGILSAFIFAVLPFNIYFSRVILPDVILVFFGLGAVYFTDKWIFENRKSLFFLSLVFMIGGFLTKPYIVFYFLPLIYSVFKKEGKIWPLPKRYWIFGALAVLPLILWRFWINQHPEGIPASQWLLNGSNIRFKPVFWQWIIQERFGKEILTVFGSVLFAVGLLIKPRLKESAFLHLFLLGNFLFLIVFATGNVQHDYYQTFIIPSLVIFTARGFVLLLEGIPSFLPKLWTIPLAFLFLVMTFYSGWSQVKGLYQINNDSIIKAGKAADRLLPKEAYVVAPYQGDTSFLYQTNRAGLAFVTLPVDELHEKFKIDYFVSVAKDAKTNWVMRKYHVIEEAPEYVIIDLTKQNPDFDYVNDKEPS